jgi:CheY-like chemotaxis protein
MALIPGREGEMTDATGLAGKKILVIDDEPDIVTYLCTLLEDHGMVTCSAVDGVEGLEQARAENPDLITLDMSMPEKSGVKLFRELQADAVLDRIPVVIVTGLSQDFESFIHKRKQVRPPEGYIAKPLTEDEVIDTLRGILVG